MKLALPIALVLATSSCVSFRFERRTVNLPPRPGAVQALVPEKSTLDDALRALGAPLFAWEWREEGMALAWGHSEDSGRGITLSVPLDTGGSAQASYDDLARHLRGIVLFFDADTRLVDVREGALNDLRAELERRRPAPLE